MRMSEAIGFVIISHNHPQQLLRLVRCLQRNYDNPPIAIHHDLGQSQIRREDFPSDIRFVSPYVKTRWAQFSIVVAGLRSLELLYENATPNWFVLLSGADYPVMPAGRVLEELATSDKDALLEYREVPTSTLPLSTQEHRAVNRFTLPGNLALAWHRYVALNLWFPIIRSGPRIGRYTIPLPIKDWRAPFGPQFKCFYGDQWFTGTRRVAEILLNPTKKHMQLRRYLRLRTVPDECYYQTVIANIPGLKISKATRRFSEWTGGSHPKVLDLNDLEAIDLSKAHFARKFTPDSPVLDEIDKILSR
jgi:Core-2/I-Branching enzyme